MNNLRIGTRLAIAFGFMVALLLLLASVGATRMAALNTAVDDLAQGRYPKVNALQRIAFRVSDEAQVLRILTLHADASARAKDKEEFANDRAEIAKDVDLLEKSLHSAKARSKFEAVLAARKDYLALSNDVIALAMDGKTAEASALLSGPRLATEQAYLQAISDLTTYQEDEMKAATTQAQSTYERGLTTLGVAAAAAVLGAIAFGLFITRSITRPLHTAIEAVDRVAAGDLTRELAITSRDETGVMLGALMRMQAALRDVVGNVRRNSESVASASGQIAQGNQDLSSRTEQQASALQETAASMEQLGTTVKQNADNAQQANQLAQGASSTAVKGGEVVSRVVDTMKGINDSSRRIADIIGVIDGIAFQTNILALNAAVEAARAGEQGRGFAVVASEVRNLAQRSAEAAREIKALISASVERVEAGTVLVDQAGATMTEVVAAIRRVTDIVGEISAASSEQSAGVGQVGLAVSQMDQATQQNAALVEESAAAAESLKAQARQLVDAVAVFKLAHG
ncbi:MAG: MCP four helix bundle domain-containing protein [Burkholderiales bacterium]|nr:MCP four helix bundle domain-containing protein [Burkholderiales bacterium]MDE2394045.1 MCP four helix bundle domain-containing protein [Burkholderiales bacterium]MDE2455004.1 MCP four helix bundle domain-containing protein [Burkholderiales bacterium]